MIDSLSVTEEEFIEANPKLVFIPCEAGGMAVYNPSSAAIAHISQSAFQILMFTRIPHTIDSLWKRFPEIDETEREGFDSTIEKLMMDGFLKKSDPYEEVESVYIPDKPKIIPDFPMHVVVHTTFRCNLSCSYCYNRDIRVLQSDELRYEEWERVFNQMKSTRLKEIIISGGETLIRKDLLPLIANLKDTGIKTILGTNGTLLDQDCIDIVKQAFSEVNLSIDSYRESEHDANRGTGSHAECIRAAELLSARNIPWRAQMVFNSVNYTSFSKTEKFVRALGAMKLVVSLDTTSEIARKQMHKYMIPRYWAVADGTEMKPLKIISACPAGYAECAIDPLGNVYPCQMMMHGCFKGLNILEHGFSTAWKESECLNSMREFDIRDVPECSDCDFAGLCNGGCRGIAYDQSGSLDGFIGNTHCRFLKWTRFEKIKASKTSNEIHSNKHNEIC